MNQKTGEESGYDEIVLGGGCFWCVEALLRRVPGVIEAVPGYAGGRSSDPTYEEVCTGTTGHAEVVRVRFDSARITLEQLLYVFFAIHDPTTPNSQGNDIGTQYRSIILYADGDQKSAAEAIIERLTKRGRFENPIVTQIAPLGNFYEAESYHRDYFEKNPGQPYCLFVIRPKIEHLSDILKEG
jgi:peptide-methionine (S)-S-oxide reductase